MRYPKPCVIPPESSVDGSYTVPLPGGEIDFTPRPYPRSGPGVGRTCRAGQVAARALGQEGEKEGEVACAQCHRAFNYRTRRP
ncbi:MAG TPA: hypothetical protein VLB73_00695 [Patescibacteria group bacterium]|nr:hypothetical protein [Patescibacteria group bacterium]